MVNMTLSPYLQLLVVIYQYPYGIILKVPMDIGIRCYVGREWIITIYWFTRTIGRLDIGIQAQAMVGILPGMPYNLIHGII